MAFQNNISKRLFIYVCNYCGQFLRCLMIEALPRIASGGPIGYNQHAVRVGEHIRLKLRQFITILCSIHTSVIPSVHQPVASLVFIVQNRIYLEVPHSSTTGRYCIYANRLEQVDMMKILLTGKHARVHARTHTSTSRPMVSVRCSTHGNIKW